MSENRSLAVLEILVHLSASLPDRYVLGAADIPDDIAVEILDESGLPGNWSTLYPREQEPTRRVGDHWVTEQRSAILSVPSAIHPVEPIPSAPVSNPASKVRVLGRMPAILPPENSSPSMPLPKRGK